MYEVTRNGTRKNAFPLQRMDNPPKPPDKRTAPPPHSGGPPFRRSAIPGVRVRVRVNLSGPPEWRTGIQMSRGNRSLVTSPCAHDHINFHDGRFPPCRNGHLQRDCALHRVTNWSSSAANWTQSAIEHSVSLHLEFGMAYLSKLHSALSSLTLKNSLEDAFIPTVI